MQMPRLGQGHSTLVGQTVLPERERLQTVQVRRRQQPLHPLVADKVPAQVEVLDPTLTDRVYEHARAALDSPDEARARLAVATAALRGRTREFNARVAEFLQES